MRLDGTLCEQTPRCGGKCAGCKPAFYVGPNVQEWVDEVRAVVLSEHNDPSWSDPIELNVHEENEAWADEVGALVNEP